VDLQVILSCILDEEDRKRLGSDVEVLQALASSSVIRQLGIEGFRRRDFRRLLESTCRP
jgi:hypothetical protein